MRAIVKQGVGGYHLTQSHANPPTTPAQATSRWGSFGHKAMLQVALLDEQYQLCCYSEIRADQEELGFHIEHVENKGENPARTFDYSNLAASALHSSNLSKVSSGEAFGGHASGKQKSCDMSQFVSCHQPDCGRYFAYLSDGRIEPAVLLDPDERGRAQYTIDLLNLDSPYLRNQRRRWWDELDQLFQQHVQDDWSLEYLAATDLVPTNGQLNRFFSLTRQFFGQIAENVLQHQAPELA